MALVVHVLSEIHTKSDPPIPTSVSEIDLMASFASMTEAAEPVPDPERAERDEIRKVLAAGELKRCQR